MYNFDPYNVLLVIATNIPVLLMTYFYSENTRFSADSDGYGQQVKERDCEEI